MKGIKLKAGLAGRKALLGVAAVAVVGLSLVTAGTAHAALGTSTGTLTFSAMSGSTATSPTWSQGVACPGADSASAKLLVVLSDGVTEQSWSAVVNGAATALTNRALVGTTPATIAQLWNTTGYADGSTAELVVNCYSAASGGGTIVPFNDAWITVTGSTYTISDIAPVGPVTPTVTLQANPSTVQVGNTVTLSATVMNGSTPVTAGSVQFSGSAGAIGSPVPLSASGVATTTTSYTTVPTGGTDSLTAQFQSSDTAHFNNNTSAAVTETVSATNPLAGNETIQVTVTPSGTFTFTVPTVSGHEVVDTLTVNGSTASGAIAAPTVTDSRTGIAPNIYTAASLVNGFSGFPGWNVVGQATNFTNPSSNPVGTILATNLSWTPSAPAGDYVQGSTAAFGGTSPVLAAAAEGHGQGTSTPGAALTLTLPGGIPSGLYSSELTLTADPVANFGL
jgi:hypothetical protein